VNYLLRLPPNRSAARRLDIGVKTIRGPHAIKSVRSLRSSEAPFAAFVEPHWVAMERLSRRLAPEGQWEETLQDALLTAWRKRGQYDPERGSARAWLLSVVADKAYKRHRRKHLPTAALAEAMAAEPNRTSTLDVRAAVAALPLRQRTAIVLYYYLDLPIAEIAQVMGCSTGTVKSTLADGRRGLQTQLGKDYSLARH
jgi:RNA polymerase sigma factor (sigma-70 family)